MKATTKQVIQIQSAASKRFKDREERLDFFSSFCNREIKSTKELTQWEAQELILFLNTGRAKDLSEYARFDNKNAQHRHILSVCHQLGWTLDNGYVDLTKLGSWIASDFCPISGKRLKQMSPYEISRKIIPALQNMLKKKYP